VEVKEWRGAKAESGKACGNCWCANMVPLKGVKNRTRPSRARCSIWLSGECANILWTLESDELQSVVGSALVLATGVLWPRCVCTVSSIEPGFARENGDAGDGTKPIVRTFFTSQWIHSVLRIAGLDEDLAAHRALKGRGLQCRSSRGPE